MTNTSIARLFEMTPQGIGKWKKEKRPIINFIEKYFTDKDIEEFLSAGKIDRFETIQSNNYLISKSVKLYNAVALILGSKVKKFFFNQLAKLDSFEIEDISNIIFYKIKNDYLDTNEISEMSIRLNIFNKFQEIDSFEIEYFIRNFKEIRKQSFLSSLNDNKYYYTPDDYKFFNEKFFKIEKENFFKITNFKEYNGTITLFLDIFSAIYHNETKSIKTSETLETNKKLILSDDDIHIFLDVISY